MDKRCKFCQRDIKDVNETFYENEETGEVLCKDCGYNDIDELETKPVKEDVPEAQQNIKAFAEVLPYLAQWRAHQMAKYNRTTKTLSHRSMEFFVIEIEDRLNAMKKSIVKNKVGESKIFMVDLICTAISYFESHLPELDFSDEKIS